MFHWWVLLLWDSTPLWILHAVITDARLGLRVFWWHRLLLRMQMNRHYSLEMTEERESPKSWWWFRESLERQGGRIWRKAIFVSPDSKASVHRKQLFFLKSIQKHKHLNQTPVPAETVSSIFQRRILCLRLLAAAFSQSASVENNRRCRIRSRSWLPRATEPVSYDMWGTDTSISNLCSFKGPVCKIQVTIIDWQKLNIK